MQLKALFVAAVFLILVAAAMHWSIQEKAVVGLDPAPAATSLPTAEERIALLIGNSRYEHITPLRNPENDVSLMAEALQRAGFKVRSETNLTLETMRSAIESFSAEATAKPGAVVVLYYAGHGVQVDGRNYMLPTDLHPDSDEQAELEASAIEVDSVLGKLDKALSRIQMILLDACRNDPFPDKGRGARRIGLQAEEAAHTGRLIAFSTAPGKTADDGSSGNSPYAGALAEVIVTPGLRIEDVFSRVRSKVLERTGQKQEPWETVSLSGEPFYFIPARADSKAAGDSEEVIWDLASVVATAESFQRYLDRFPEGQYASLARLRIDAFNRDDTFFRRNETFPIVTGVYEDTTVCRYDYPKGLSGVGEFRNAYGLREQLVYVSFAIGLSELICTRDGGSSLTLIAPTGTACSDFVSELWPYDLPKGLGPIDCWSGEKQSDQGSHFAEDEWAQSLLERGGGIWIDGGDGTTIVLPFTRADYWSTEMGIAEGHFESAAVSFDGFARLRERGAEDMVALFFDPFDPRDRGLTGRAENSKRRVSEQDRMSASDVVYISKPGNGSVANRGWDDEPATTSYADLKSLIPTSFGVPTQSLENLPNSWEGYRLRPSDGGQEYCAVMKSEDGVLAFFTSPQDLQIHLFEAPSSDLISTLLSNEVPMLTVMVDSSREWTIRAETEAKAVRLNLGGDWMIGIQGGNELSFEASNGNRAAISLQGSRAALDALDACHRGLQ